MSESESNSGGRIAGEIGGVLALAAALLAGISLYSYHPDDPSLNRYLSEGGNVHNLAGAAGAFLADGLVQLAGGTAWLVAAALGVLGIALVRGPEARGLALSGSGAALMVVAAASLSHVVFGEADPLFTYAEAGGMIGVLVAQKLVVPWFARYGSYVLLGSLLLASILMMARTSLLEACRKGAAAGVVTAAALAAAGRWGGARVGAAVSRLWGDGEEQRALKEKKKRIRQKERERSLVDEAFPLDDDDQLPPFEMAGEPTIVDFSTTDELAGEPVPVAGGPTVEEARKGKKGKGKKNPDDLFQQEIFEYADSHYEYPTLDLLDEHEHGTVVRQSKDDLIKQSRILEKKLADFGIAGRVTQVLPGPVITIFEFEPAPGVKVSRIVSLADDLAMSLRALSIRIVAPIPGKSVVGIEVPNVHREPVFLKEILASDEFRGEKAQIPLALGRDIAGKPMVADLATVPHLLIAGSTGSGKSVGINTMVCSVLYRLRPSEVKFIMIDPKMLELSIYDGIPHLIAPVVTNPKKAANALKWLVAEMERRYEMLSAAGVRNIANYNRIVERKVKDLARQGITIEEARAAAGDEELDENLTHKDSLTEKLPYIVVVIDELADLMMVASKEVEDSLARLAQMARAAGIHLIVATQRPSVDVLTGLIKANFPARVSFQVRSRVDSRTIIDSMGAEKLLGRGDLLYLAPGAASPTRIQGPFVADEEIHRVVDYLKKQSAPEYNDEILRSRDDGGEGGMDGDGEDADEFYNEAVELVARTRQASVSMIQRKLRIGYNRAARIVEMMEREGLVGPSDGAKPREVFIRPIEDMEEAYN